MEEKNFFKLFISHRDSYKVKANEIKNTLLLYGISSFVAHEDIEPSEEWVKEIEKSLFSMDALLALLTKNFFESVWTNQEIGVAIGQKKFILSVKFGKTPEGFVEKIQALRPKDEKMETVCGQIVEHLLKHPNTQEKMITAYFLALQRTCQYADTEKWAAFLDLITNVNKKQIEILIDAYNNNGQAYDCFKLNGDYENISLASRINQWINKNTYCIKYRKITKRGS